MNSYLKWASVDLLIYKARAMTFNAKTEVRVTKAL